MSVVPRDANLDSALALMRDGNTFITHRCRRYQTDIFETRLLLKQTFCIMGEEAATIFYNEGKLTRRGAMPISTLRLLQDKGSVATLDGEAHYWRKQMFMSLMSSASIDELADLTECYWRGAIGRWQGMNEVDFFNEIQEILCKAVCEWTGITLTDVEIKQRTREIATMIDGAGAIGPRNWRGALLRSRCEKWIGGIVEQVRSGKRQVAKGRALDTIAAHKDIAGNSLPVKIAAVELLNILRPTVAVARYILFAAIAMHHYPECREKLARDTDGYLECFVQEVRRFYPFFPFIGGVVRESFTWKSCYFPVGARVLLDVYGTNHDSRIWHDPETFEPERFRNWQPNAFSLIPQGGGDFLNHHRCAGENLTIALIKRAVHLLVNIMDYNVVDADLEINLHRMPALPKQPMIITKVKPR